jgi:hypothetical protein
MIPFAGILTLVFWGIVALLLFILYAIARFYQVTSGQVTYYRWFIAPAILLLAGATRYALLGVFLGDTLSDVLIFLGGLVLSALAYRLLQLMIGGRR